MENELRHIFGDRLKLDEPLSKHLNFRIGGPAAFFCEVQTVEELEHALSVIGDTPYFVLGGGSNTLASDEGFDGVVFKLAMRNVQIEGNIVAADAGAISAAVARQTANAGLAGFTWAISLPGTMGGAARGNAGCFGGEMKDTLLKVEVLRDGKIVEVPAKELRYGYRESSIKHSKDIVLRVYLELEPGDAEALKEDLTKKVTARKESQPLHAGSAGCIFKNYEIKNQEELEEITQRLDLPEAMRIHMRVSAGWLVDHMGLKGKHIGDAQISEEHGNFIINHGSATASDVVQLISLVKTKARDEYGIQLHEEVQYVGF